MGQAIQISSKNETEITTALINYFGYYGVPENITTDNGTEIKNATVQELLKAHKIQVHFITPRNPPSNGLIERLHSTLIEHLRIMRTQDKNTSIKLQMQYAIIAYNNSIHSSTGYTNLELILGHTNSRDPYDLFLNDRFYKDYVTNHINK